ncbi:MAG: class I adenylate-forming enzyme family protein, partial [Pseudomonadota bacterium]
MKQHSDKIHDVILQHITAPGQLLAVETIQKPWGDQLVFTNAPANLGDFFKMMLEHAEETFIVYGDERYTFREVWIRSNQVASALQSNGIAKGDRIVIAMRNYPEWIFTFIGIVLNGGIAVPLNAWWSGPELAAAIEDAGANLAFVDELRSKRLKEVNASVNQVVVREKRGFTAISSFDKFVEGGQQKSLKVNVQASDDATIFYTSGSTSYPKGVISTHQALVNAMFNFAAFGLTQQEVEKQIGDGTVVEPEQAASLLTVPLFHITGCHSIFMVSVLIGRKIVLLDKWEPEEALMLIEKERVSTFMGVPTMSRELTEHPNFSDYDLSSLKEINAGGAARPTEHANRLFKKFPEIKAGVAYGLTETNGSGALNIRDGYKTNPASVGRAPEPLAELAILDEAGNQLADHEVGEIAVRSITLARGYWNRPEDTKAAFLANGWFRTGDLGYLEGGYLTIVDRKKDMILRGGENVSCLEVESAMLSDPDVREACVFGVPENRLGEAVKAVIYTDSSTDFNESKHRV